MKKNIVKKSLYIKSVMVIAICFIFGGCVNNSYFNIDGYAEVNNAKKLFSELDSGHFYMQNNTTGQKTEEFTFMYNPNGSLAYSHTATDGDDIYYEYCNGAELSYKYKRDENWTLLTYGDEDFTVYTKDNKHPYTNGGVISVNAYAITSSTVEETGGGGKKVTFYYNPASLMDALSEMGTLKNFESSLWLDSEGYCYRLDQKAVFDNEGENVSDYSLFIDSMNSVSEISKP